MDNRFKFRFWDKQRQIIRDVWSVTPFGAVVNDVKTENYRIPLKDCVIMQCTGLKDKAGKLIFEGDIAIVEGIVCVIKWDNDKCAFFAETASEYFAFEEDITIEDFEIIGNIYQNPELMEE